MKRSICFFIIMSMLFAAGCSRNPLKTASAVNRYQDGCKAYDKGEYEKAAEDFKEAVRRDGSGKLLVDCYSYLGHCMMELGDTATAQKYYETALSTGDKRAMCYTNLGIYYRRCQNFERAESYYRMALETDDTYTDALTSLGVLYAISDRTDAAIPLLEQAIEIAEEPPAVYDANLAYAYAAADRFDEARSRLAVAKAKGYSEEDYARILAYLEERERQFVPSVQPNPDTGFEEPEPTPEPALTQRPEPTPEPALTQRPEPTPEPALTQKPEPTPEPALTQKPEPAKPAEASAGKRIVIDPGHQQKANHGKEPVGPGASELKMKVSAGTQGVSTGVPEHQLNLELSLRLRDALTEAGYEVIMTRERAEVDLSNAERAELANEADADIFLRIHADGAENAAANGISVLYPSESNPYVAALSPASKRLAQQVLEGMCEETGARNRGIVTRDDLSGTNWAKMPVIVVEAGFMTNEEEERKLLSADYQALLVRGITEGVQEYFKE